MIFYAVPQSHISLLAELQMSFDKAILQGKSFGEVKRIYIRIKALKRYLRGMSTE